MSPEHLITLPIRTHVKLAHTNFMDTTPHSAHLTQTTHTHTHTHTPYTLPHPWPLPVDIIYDCDIVDFIVHGNADIFGSKYADRSVSEHNSDPLLVSARKLCCRRLWTPHLKRQRECIELHSHWETHDIAVDTTVTWCHLDCAFHAHTVTHT